MPRVKTSQRTYARLWKRFDELAAMNDAERRDVYGADGMRFLGQLMVKTLRNHVDPGIESAEEFSAFIVTLRGNYRQWNQHLMGLTIKCDSLKDAQSRDQLVEFAATCHWKALAEAARNLQN